MCAKQYARNWGTWGRVGGHREKEPRPNAPRTGET